MVQVIGESDWDMSRWEPAEDLDAMDRKVKAMYDDDHSYKDIAKELNLSVKVVSASVGRMRVRGEIGWKKSTARSTPHRFADERIITTMGAQYGVKKAPPAMGIVRAGNRGS